jgi:DNA ligase-1
MFARLSALEAQYVVRLLGGELRIGVDEALIEEALAAAFSQPLDAVRRATGSPTIRSGCRMKAVSTG